MLAASAYRPQDTLVAGVVLFPFQLLVLHVKKNHFLLVFWLVAASAPG